MRDNLQLLREAGAELVPFSPLQDESLPEGIAGLIFRRWLPELHAKALSKNTPMRKAVHDAVAGGLPTIAECGGFLYLHETLCDDEGVCYPMAGVISASAKNTGKLVRFGYVMLTERRRTSYRRARRLRDMSFTIMTARTTARVRWPKSR